MAERAKKPPARSNGAPGPAPVPNLSRIPTDLLRRRTAMFLRMTQGAGKPMQYPGPPKRGK